MNRENKIELMCAIVLVGFFLAVTFHYIIGFYFKHAYPLNTFLFEPGTGKQFSDFKPIYFAASHLNPYDLAPSSGGVYFPFTYLIYFFFTFFHLKNSLFIFLTLFISFMCWLTHRYCKINYYPSENLLANRVANFKNIFILTLMAYPTLFCIERANSECLIFIFAGLFFINYSQKKFFLSAIFLACATAMKGYFGLFILLFLLDKHYKEAFIFCFLTGLFTVVSLILLKHSIFYQLVILKQNLIWFRSYFVMSDISLMYNTSLYAATKVFAHLLHHVPPGGVIPTSLANINHYSVCAGIFLVFIILYLFFFETVFWKKVTVLTACCLLLPQISFDYHLVQIYFPIFFFINSDRSEIFRKNDLIYTVIFSLLLIPKNFYLIYGEYSISSFLNTLLLASLIALIVGENLVGKFKKFSFRKVNF